MTVTAPAPPSSRAATAPARPRAADHAGWTSRAAVDFLLACTVLGGLMGWYGLSVGINALLAPLFMILAAATALGVGLVFSVINVRYRDVPYAIPFVIQIWLFLSPVIYPIKALHHSWERLILSLNPMSGPAFCRIVTEQGFLHPFLG